MKQAQARSAAGRQAASRLFWDPGLVVAGRGRAHPVRPERPVRTECRHSAGQIGRRLLLERAGRRQRLVGQVVDRALQPHLPAGRDPASVIAAVVDHPAAPAIVLVLVIDVAVLVAPDLASEAASEQRRADRRAVPPREDLRPETHRPAHCPVIARSASYQRTRSPGAIPSSAALPPRISSTTETGSSPVTGSSECGTVFAAMRAIVPSGRMNSMSRGIRVFFIQKATSCGGSYGKIMPASGASCLRNIRPAACSCGVRATSTVKRCSPFAEEIVSGTCPSSVWAWFSTGELA